MEKGNFTPIRIYSNNRKTKLMRGFTLVETMVVVVIVVFIFFAIVVAYLNVWRISQAAQESAIKVQEDTRRAINFMCRELRSAYIDSDLKVGDWKDENDVNWLHEIEFKMPVYTGNYINEDTDEYTDGQRLYIGKPEDEYPIENVYKVAPDDERYIYVKIVADDPNQVDKGAYLREEDPSVTDDSTNSRTKRSIKYLLENDKIKRRLFDSADSPIFGEDTVLANNVQFLGFMKKSDADPGIIIIRVRVKKRTFDWKAIPETEFSLTGRVALRN